MGGNGQAFAQERQRLKDTIAIASEQLEAARQKNENKRAAMIDARRELRERSSQMFGSLWSAQNFHELVDLNQFSQPLVVEQQTGEMLLERIDALRRMLDRPYFARVDIRFDDGGDTEQVYIGRASLKEDKTREIWVYDWRAPIASVFYRFATGRVHYDAPGGRITGNMDLKRQFEINNGELEYFFDADVEVQDEFLRTMLACNASPRMKAIVETIQRDQDAAIRDTEHELLMVQGVAGSGKTSIALHRAAYLMYRGRSRHLSANDILILSPNALFERYIHGVLPELGEQNVRTLTLEQMLSDELGDARVQHRGERLERLLLCGDSSRHMRENIAFKASPAFVELLERFARELPRRWIEFEDVYYGGRIIATRQQLKARVLSDDAKAPLGVRLRHMEQSLWDGIRERRSGRMRKLEDRARQWPRHALEIEACVRAYSILECAALQRHIRRFTRLDCRALYERLFSDERALSRLCQGLKLPMGLETVVRYTREALKQDALPLEDAAAIAYLQTLIQGVSGQSRIRQVVVDEAQDYSPLHFALLGRLFPRASFTVLGDINQTLDERRDMSLYEQIQSSLNRRSAVLVLLNKSFRCTSEILRYSLRFLDSDADIQGFNRSGSAPGEHAAQGASELVRLIKDEVALCRQAGYNSIALITKTVRDARAWHARLAPGIRLIDAGDWEPTGAFIMPLHLSKGLEFDAVLVLDADSAHYGSADDKRLLYVACTRALHRLNLFYMGERSPLL